MYLFLQPSKPLFTAPKAVRIYMPDGRSGLGIWIGTKIWISIWIAARPLLSTMATCCLLLIYGLTSISIYGLIYGSVNTAQAQDCQPYKLSAKQPSSGGQKPKIGPGSYSFDRTGNLVCFDQSGSILKYDTAGTLLYSNSPDRPAIPTLLEAWPTLRILAFYREFQEYRIYDRLLNNTDVIKVPTVINYARLLAPSADDQLWVIDDGDFALKKVHPLTGQVSISQPLPLVWSEAASDAVFLKEYQNRVFILFRSGAILEFDNMGNFKTSFRAKAGVDHFDTSGNLIYWFDGTTLITRDIYTSSERKIACELPTDTPQPTIKFLLNGRVRYLVGE